MGRAKVTPAGLISDDTDDSDEGLILRLSRKIGYRSKPDSKEYELITVEEREWISERYKDTTQVVFEVRFACILFEKMKSFKKINLASQAPIHCNSIFSLASFRKAM
jgi:hypothetical protein